MRPKDSSQNLVRQRTILFAGAVLVAVIAVAAVMTGLAQGASGQEVAVPEGEGAVSSWNIPYDPASRGVVMQVQEFLGSQQGAQLLSQAPGLDVFKGMNPNSEVQRRMAGALGLPVGSEGRQFKAKLAKALKASDHGALNDISDAILSAYQNNDFQAKVAQAATSRANDVIAVKQGKLSPEELSAACADLAPFAGFAEVEAVMTLSRVVAMTDARRIAAALMENRAVGDLAGNIYVPEGHSTMVYNAQGHYVRVIDAGRNKADIVVDGEGNLHVRSLHGHEIYSPHGSYVGLQPYKPSSAKKAPELIPTPEEVSGQTAIKIIPGEYLSANGFKVSVEQSPQNAGILDVRADGATKDGSQFVSFAFDSASGKVSGVGTRNFTLDQFILGDDGVRHYDKYGGALNAWDETIVMSVNASGQLISLGAVTKVARWSTPFGLNSGPIKETTDNFSTGLLSRVQHPTAAAQ